MTDSYYRPSTIEEATDILSKYGAELKIIAGCTDVSVAREEKMLDRFKFMDISYIKSLSYINEKDGFVCVGPMATHAGIGSSDVIKKHGSVLSQACLTVGSPLIRNRGTIGGNISHGSPSGDSIPAVMALNGEMKLVSTKGERWVRAVEYFKGPGKTVREQNELLAEIRFRPTLSGYFHLFQKLGQRKALACSKASMAFTAKVENGVFSDVRIACGAVAPTVVRCSKTEAFLEGKKFSKELAQKAAEIVSTEISPIDDLRSTREYRINVMGELLIKAMNQAAAVI